MLGDDLIFVVLDISLELVKERDEFCEFASNMGGMYINDWRITFSDLTGMIDYD